MARLFALAVLFTSLFTVNLAWADRGYRVVPITTDSGSTDVFAHDVNNRGEVVGFSFATGQQHAFRWRDGVYTDLHDVIAPNAFSTRVEAINDRSTIFGSLITTSFQPQAYLLRNGQVTQVEPVPGVDTFASDINNLGQILSSNAGRPQGCGCSALRLSMPEIRQRTHVARCRIVSRYFGRPENPAAARSASASRSLPASMTVRVWRRSLRRCDGSPSTRTRSATLPTLIEPVFLS
jgi:probable HAF family extracellular repeat protein